MTYLRALLCVVVLSSLEGCSLFYVLFSNNTGECDDDETVPSCDGDVSVVCIQSPGKNDRHLIHIDCGESGCDEFTGECRPRCGDGVLSLGEECDPPEVGLCRTDCFFFPVCGDGFPSSTFGETCDDGNTTNGDGCRSDCTVESCGDAIVDVAAGEECDDGLQCQDGSICGVGGTSCVGIGDVSCLTRDGDGCSADCLIEGICGDSLIGAGETCDDGNLLGGDGCGPDCLTEGVCGNGVVNSGEECDDGNQVSNDGCESDCTESSLCGNGIINIPELCDQGPQNGQPGSFCDANCEAAGFVTVQETERNDDGSPNTGGLNGNDFSSANANGPFAVNVVVLGALNPAGDEDVFSVQNETGVSLSLRFDIFDTQQGAGFGRPCGPSQTGGMVINARGASGNILAVSAARPADSCHGLDFTLDAGQTLFVHTFFGASFAVDNVVVPSYMLAIELQ
jgi:cysteine-rich repeat protein